MVLIDGSSAAAMFSEYAGGVAADCVREKFAPKKN
jgi:hypothetical protein